MSLRVRRQSDESWRDCAIRYAKHYGLESEVLEIFDAEISEGMPEDAACWSALREWDLLDFVDD